MKVQPLGLKVFGVLFILIGLWGLLSLGVALVVMPKIAKTISAEQRTALTATAREKLSRWERATASGAKYPTVFYFNLYFNAVIFSIAIINGFGILLLKPWTRWLTLGWTLLSGQTKWPILFGLGLGAFFYLIQPSVKAQFTKTVTSDK